MKDFIDSLGTYFWVGLISIISGILGMRERHKLIHCKTFGCRIINGLFGIVTSALVGYIAYSITFHFFKEEGLGIALAGIAGWGGTDTLVFFERRIADLITKLTERNIDDFKR